MIITVTKEGYVLLKDLKPLLDIRKVVYYSFKKNKDGTLTLKFYDENNKLIRPKKAKKK